jgi:hypothetical protein
MTEPLGYQILLNLQSALRSISTGAGYFFTADSGAVSIDPVDVIEIVLGRAASSPFIVIELGVEGRPTYQPASQMLEFLPFNVIAFANATHNDPVSRAKIYEQLCADVEKALLADLAGPGSGMSRGGLATDTRVTGKQMQVTTGSLRVVAIVQVEVKTYREYGKPNG